MVRARRTASGGESEEVEQGVRALAERVGGLVAITNDDEFRGAGEFLLKIKEARKRIEGVFGEVVKTAYAAWKAATSKRKEFEAPLDEAEKVVRALLGGYQDRKAREQMAAAEASALLAEQAGALEVRGDVSGAGELMARANAPLPEPPKVEGLSFREDWTYEVVDAAAIPREFLAPDEAKIGRYIRAMRSEARILGVRIWAIKIPVAR